MASGQTLLDDFVYAYHQAFEAKLDEIGRDRFPYHGERTPLVYTVRCKDGIATFYFATEGHPWQETPPGLRIYEHQNESLDTICQASSDNRLRVVDPRIGGPLLDPEYEPKEKEDLPEWAKP